MGQTNSILIKLLKDGNTEVFESIYNKFYSSLFVYAREYAGSEEVAKELVQDTFLKLWEVKATLKDDTHLSSYLYRITRNNCLNYLKHLKVQEKYRDYSASKRMELELNYSALSQDSADQLVSEELEEKINQAIDSLPPRCKQVFELSRFHDKKYREIAQDLNISIKTVENQMQKALKVLRENLKGLMNSIIILFL